MQARSGDKRGRAVLKEFRDGGRREKFPNVLQVVKETDSNEPRVFPGRDSVLSFPNICMFKDCSYNLTHTDISRHGAQSKHAKFRKKGLIWRIEPEYPVGFTGWLNVLYPFRNTVMSGTNMEYLESFGKNVRLLLLSQKI